MENNFVYKSNGFYLGFINGTDLFSRDGIYMGWIDGTHVWDARGIYRGELVLIGGTRYILRNRFIMPPVSRNPRSIPAAALPPAPPANIRPISLPVESIDAF